MFNNLLNKGKCALGFHQGEWVHNAADNCTVVQICERCGNEAQKIEHTWGDWDYIQADDCTLARVCARCQEKETTLEHQWDAVQYSAVDSCEQVQICLRCQAENPVETVHQWDKWDYADAENCLQVASCSRCQAISQQTRLYHEWTDPIPSEFYETQVTHCEHCGDMAFPAQNEHLTMRDMENAVEALIQSLPSEQHPSILTTVHQHQQVLLQTVTDNYVIFAAERLGQDNPTFQYYGKALNLMEQARTIGVDAAVQTEYAPPTPEPTYTAPATSHVPSPAPPTSSSELDRALVGHWRHTDSMSSDGFSMATDTHLILDGHGNSQRYSQTVSSFSNQQSGIERGKWTVENGNLVVNFGMGNERFVYEVHPDSLFFPNEGHFRLWSRVG